MAIIYSYPLVTSIQPSDLLILSVDSSELPTRQVTVGDLLASGTVGVNLNFTADTGTGSVNLSTQSLEVRQGVYITTTATNQELIINHKSTVRQDTNIGDTSPGYGGSFTVIDSVVTDATGSGHVTGVNLKTVTLPSADDTNTTYDLLGYNTGIELVGSDGTRDQIQIVGSGDTTVSQANNIITVSSTSAVPANIVETLTAASGTYISLTNAASATGDVDLGTFDLNAADGDAVENERYLTKNNTWAEVATIPGTYTFDVTADGGTNQTILSGETLDIAGGTYITTSVGDTDTVTINHDNTTRTDTTSTESPGYSGTFTAVDSISTNNQGHLTAVNLKTVTMPSADDTNTTYDLEGVGSANGTAGVRLAGSDTTNDDVLIVGAGTTGVVRAGNTLTVTSNDQYTGTVTSVGTSAPLTGDTITTTGTIGITQATTSTDGYLSSTDWNTFNNKQDTITNPVTGTGVATRVAFWNGTSSLSSNADLYWDNTNSRLGIGTALPNAKLDVDGTMEANQVIVKGDSQPLIIAKTTTPNAHITMRMDGEVAGFISSKENHIGIGGNNGYSTDNLNIAKGNGYVGVKQKLPLAPLHIKSNGEAIRLESTGDNECSIDFRQGTNKKGHIEFDNSVDTLEIKTTNPTGGESQIKFSTAIGVGAEAVERMRIRGNQVVIGNPLSVPSTRELYVNGSAHVTGQLFVGGDTSIGGRCDADSYKLKGLNTPPATATSPGTNGEIRYTTDYIYVCVADNVWKRTALTTW